MNALTYIYLTSIGIATLVGLNKFKTSLPIHIKAIMLLLPYILMVEVGVVIFRNSIKDSTIYPQYNVVMLTEFLVYAFFFKQLIKSKFVRQLLSIFLLVFPAFWYVSVFFIFGITTWNSYIFLVGGTFTIIWAIVYCYQLLTSEENISIRRIGEFWIALGIIIFYSCQVPFMGLFNFLSANFPSFINSFQVGLQITNIIMYSLFIYAFYAKRPI